MYRCWASKDARTSEDGDDTMTNNNVGDTKNVMIHQKIGSFTTYLVVDTNLYIKEFEFWDYFCPLYNSVAPESGGNTGNGYLKTFWDKSTSIHAINFRYF